MLKKMFWNGLKAIVPVGVTIAIIVWILSAIESFFGYFLKLIIPQYYVHGMGVLLCIVLVFLVGWLLNIWLARKVHEWFTHLLKKIPLVKTLYTGLIDFMAFFEKSDEKDKMGYVVRAELDSMILLGVVTRETFDDFPEGAFPDERVAVYLPMSYNIGGYTVFLPRSKLTRIDMKGQEAIMFCLTAGMKTVERNANPS